MCPLKAGTTDYIYLAFLLMYLSTNTVIQKLLQTITAADVHFWNFSITYPTFPVKDNEAVRYATCTRLNHGYIGTWVKDVAVQTYYACM